MPGRRIKTTSSSSAVISMSTSKIKSKATSRSSMLTIVEPEGGREIESRSTIRDPARLVRKKRRARRRSVRKRSVSSTKSVSFGSAERDRRNLTVERRRQTISPRVSAVNAACVYEQFRWNSALSKTASKDTKMRGIENQKRMDKKVSTGLDKLAAKVGRMRTEIRRAPPQILSSGDEIEATVRENAVQAYRLQPNEEGRKCSVKITLKTVSGDPDLYVCQRHKYPDKSHHTWQSVSDGDDNIYISSNDAKFSQQQSIFIGIRGHTTSTYRLAATWVYQKSSSELMSKTTRIQGAHRRVKEKIAQMGNRYKEVLLQERGRKKHRFSSKTSLAAVDSSALKKLKWIAGDMMCASPRCESRSFGSYAFARTPYVPIRPADTCKRSRDFRKEARALRQLPSRKAPVDDNAPASVSDSFLRNMSLVKKLHERISTQVYQLGGIDLVKPLKVPAPTGKGAKRAATEQQQPSSAISHYLCRNITLGGIDDDTLFIERKNVFLST